MITAPSTIRPKSSAPRLIRLAEIRFCTMPVMVISMVSGMTAAVISAARRLPSSTNSTTITSSAPSSRFVADRGDGAIDECGAVVDRGRDHSVRQARIDLLQSCRGTTRNGAAVLADQHEHGAEHDLVAVLGRRAGAQLASLHDLRHLTQPDRHAVAMGDDDVAKSSGAPTWPGTRIRYCSPLRSM